MQKFDLENVFLNLILNDFYRLFKPNGSQDPSKKLKNRNKSRSVTRLLLWEASGMDFGGLWGGF